MIRIECRAYLCLEMLQRLGRCSRGIDEEGRYPGFGPDTRRAFGLVAAECAYDVDGVVDNAGAGIDYDRVSVIITALIAIRDRCQLNDDLWRHRAEALLPAGREGSVAVVLPAQAGRKIAWPIVVADEIVVVLVAEIALVLVLVMAVSVLAISVAAIVATIFVVPMSMTFVPIVVVSVTVSVFVVPVLRGGVGGWKCEGCCGGSEQQSKLASIQDVSFGEGCGMRF